MTFVSRTRPAPSEVPHACDCKHWHRCAGCGKPFTHCLPECATIDPLESFGICGRCWPRKKYGATIGRTALVAAVILCAALLSACSTHRGPATEPVTTSEPRVFVTAPKALVKAGWAVVRAEVAKDAPAEWCPTAAAWEFSDGVGGHAFQVDCQDREWSELHYFNQDTAVWFRLMSASAPSPRVIRLSVTVGAREIQQ